MRRFDGGWTAAASSDIADSGAVVAALGLLDEAVLVAVGVVSAGEVVAAEVGLEDGETAGDDHDGVADRDCGPSAPEVSGDNREWDGVVGVATAGGGTCTLSEDVGEPRVAFDGLAGGAFAASDVLARCLPGPAGEVAGGREAGRANTDPTDDGLGWPFADPGDGVEVVARSGEREHHRIDPGVEVGADHFEVGGVVQDETDEQGVVLRGGAAERLVRGRDRAVQPPSRQLGEHLGVVLACDQSGVRGTPETSSTSGATEASLRPASSGISWIRRHAEVCAWISRLRYLPRSLSLRKVPEGTSAARSRPCARRSARHSTSVTSPWQQGSIFAEPALNGFGWKPHSSGRYHGAARIEPAASVPTSIRSSAACQSVIASSPGVNGAKLGVCLDRPFPPSLAVRARGTTSCSPISTSAHRSTSSSTACRLVCRRRGGTGMANRSTKP